MRAAIFNGPHSISVGDRPDAAIAEPTDAVVQDSNLRPSVR